MLLACDIGNSHISIGIFEGGDLQRSFNIETDKNGSQKEYEIALRSTLKNDLVVDRSVVASVVPGVTDKFVVSIGKIFNVVPRVIKNNDIPVRNKYSKPETVGTDRLLNAYGAIRLFETPIIIIDFGTATTFDVISSEGEYLGGSIVPGVETSLKALFGNASKLDAVELERPTVTIGQSTEESIRSGVVIGTAGLLDKIVTEIEKDLGDSVKVATGGLAALIIPYSEKVVKTEPHLTLKAISMLEEKTKKA